MLGGVNHGDVSVDFDGLAVENRRPIPPLPNGFHRGLVKERITHNNLQRLNGALGPDDGSQFHVTIAVQRPP